MNYNSLRNKPTINYRELIGNSNVSEVGGITEEEFNDLLDTDLASYYNKAQIDELFARSYVFREKSGDIVTFDCPESTNGIAQVASEIVAVQSGSGEPSPTNIRPFTGWSAVNRYRTGKNLVGFKDGTGSAGTNRTYTISNNTVSVTSSSNVVSSQILVGTALISVLDIALFKAGTYKLSISNQTGFTETIQFVFKYGDNTNVTVNDGDTFTLTSDATLVSIVFSTSVSWNTKTLSFNAQIERGETATTYEAFSGTTYTTTLKDGQDNPMECYGGGLMNAGGSQALLVTKGHIASYNGETLPSTWLSDRDVYAAGTTPSIGAEVVYELETPLQIPQDSLSIVSTGGINNIWCDTGDITVKALDRIIQG